MAFLKFLTEVSLLVTVGVDAIAWLVFPGIGWRARSSAVSLFPLVSPSVFGSPLVVRLSFVPGVHCLGSVSSGVCVSASSWRSSSCSRCSPGSSPSCLARCSASSRGASASRRTTPNSAPTPQRQRWVSHYPMPKQSVRYSRFHFAAPNANRLTSTSPKPARAVTPGSGILEVENSMLSIIPPPEKSNSPVWPA